MDWIELLAYYDEAFALERMRQDSQRDISKSSINATLAGIFGKK